MQSYQFDDRAITWNTFDYLGTQYYVQAVDAARGIADVLIKFQPNMPGKLHQHLMDYSTFVLQGELRFWRPDGSLKEIRPTGSYVHGTAHGEPHAEGAGDQAAIVLFSIRGGTGDMFAIFEEGSDTVHKLGFADFAAALAGQVTTGVPATSASRAA